MKTGPKPGARANTRDRGHFCFSILAGRARLSFDVGQKMKRFFPWSLFICALMVGCVSHVREALKQDASFQLRSVSETFRGHYSVSLTSDRKVARAGEYLQLGVLVKNLETDAMYVPVAFDEKRIYYRFVATSPSFVPARKNVPLDGGSNSLIAVRALPGNTAQRYQIPFRVPELPPGDLFVFISIDSLHEAAGVLIAIKDPNQASEPTVPSGRGSP